MRKLTIVFHHAGGGHRSTADALKATLATQDQPWDVSLLNVQELLAPLDVMHRATGLHIEDIYNLILRKGWTRFTPQLLKVLLGTIRLAHPWLVKSLRSYWSEHPADLVVSVIPHFNRALAESLRRPEETPFVTLLTDLADYPPHFWIERESEYIIVATERAKAQAFAMGHPADRVFETSGMVLKPRFYHKTAVDRVSERKRLGLEPDCPTGIVLFGGHGSRAMLDIAKKLNESNSGVQLILICGHNHELAAQLKSLKTQKPMLVQGFTANVESYMALADFFIGKPGPGSISEALQFHLPVIVECNAKTLPQERYNAQWLTEKGFGIVVTSFREIAPTVQRLLQGPTFNEFRRNTSTYSNRALFEVPAILEQCAKRTIAPMQIETIV
ncbi:MAG TPA: glycosyltransferase [Terriglobales bacterium]|nr:glycosyltransferase [Terriglobales bacterium]